MREERTRVFIGDSDRPFRCGECGSTLFRRPEEHRVKCRACDKCYLLCRITEDSDRARFGHGDAQNGSDA